MAIIKSDIFTWPEVTPLNQTSLLNYLKCYAYCDHEGCVNIDVINPRLSDDDIVILRTQRSCYYKSLLSQIFGPIYYVNHYLKLNSQILTSESFKPSDYRNALFESMPEIAEQEFNILSKNIKKGMSSQRKLMIEDRLEELRIYIPAKTLPEKKRMLLKSGQIGEKPNCNEFRQYLLDNHLYFDYKEFLDYNQKKHWQGDWKKNCQKFASSYKNNNVPISDGQIEKEIVTFFAHEEKWNYILTGAADGDIQR